MSTDELQTMYGSTLNEIFALLLDFIVFCSKSIYFFLEMLILTITPNRYRKLKVSHHSSSKRSDNYSNYLSSETDQC